MYMLRENLEAKWIDCFEKSFLLSGVTSGNIVATFFFFPLGLAMDR